MTDSPDSGVSCSDICTVLFVDELDLGEQYLPPVPGSQPGPIVGPVRYPAAAALPRQERHAAGRVTERFLVLGVSEE